MIATNQQAQIDEFVFLVGRPPMGELIQFVQAAGGNADIPLLAREWRSANDQVIQLEHDEAGVADNPSILPLEPEVEEKAKAVVATALFQQSYAFTPVSIGEVNLDDLVVYQKQINLTYARAMAATWPASLSPADLFDVCIPIKKDLAPVRMSRVSHNAFVFSCVSNDFRFLEPTLLADSQVAGYAPGGKMSHALALILGFGANFVSALRYRGRLILNNGSHRAFALRDRGVARMPCIIQEISRVEELKMICPVVAQDIPLYFGASRPPMLKDYFDGKLRKLVNVPKKNRQVKVTFGVETIDVPA